MILLTDISFFQNKPLEIVNISESPTIAAEVNRFIRMYEPALLGDVLGLELYSALQAALLVNPLEGRFSKLLFGDTYRNLSNRLCRWKGIIETDDNAALIPDSHYSVDLKETEWTAGETHMPNGSVFPAGVNSFTNPDWIGLDVFLFHQFNTIFSKGVNFTFDSATGTLTRTKAGDVFEDGTSYGILFMPRVMSSDNIETENIPLTYKHSFIADYVYYWWMRKNATFSTGIGEKTVATSTTTPESPWGKMTDAWNDMSQWLLGMWNYLEANKDLFPEWTTIGYSELLKYRKIRLV